MKQTRTPRQPPESVSSSFVPSNFVQQATFSNENVEKSRSRLLETTGINL